ncbi:MAG: hypothetical protein HY819_16260 [Acidobacteria bacterium]|nr:hypothetical protein [Acidobacteriota bacterium]
MGLTEVQKTLALLYTNRELREKFLSNPQEIAKDFSLTPVDIEHLTALSAFHLDEFANSLQYKRLGEVIKVLSLTEKSLKSEFSDLFLEFTNNYLPSGVKKHRDDALAFTKFIMSKKNIPDWCKEIAEYEATRIELGEANKLLVIKVFRYPLKQIIQALFQNEEINIRKKRTLAIWLKLPSQTKWYHRFLTLFGS